MAEARKLDDSEKGERMLSAIYDEIDRPGSEDDECWHCGGEGYVADCFDGFCVDAESGCEDCTRRCPECAMARLNRHKRVREAVIEMQDVDVAIAWLKEIGRWDDSITRETVLSELQKEAAARAQGEG